MLPSALPVHRPALCPLDRQMEHLQFRLRPGQPLVGERQPLDRPALLEYVTGGSESETHSGTPSPLSLTLCVSLPSLAAVGSCIPFNFSLPGSTVWAWCGWKTIQRTQYVVNASNTISVQLMRVSDYTVSMLHGMHAGGGHAAPHLRSAPASLTATPPRLRPECGWMDLG